MNAKELLDAGDIVGTIDALNQALRVRPADSHLRVFLFEVLCLAGDYDRAAKQLDVLTVRAPDPGAELALHGYGQLLVAEKLRRQVFAGAALPKFLLTPPPAVEQYVVLLAKLAAAGRECAHEYEVAAEAAPALPGQLGDTPFADLRDGDDRLGPVLEVFHGADYLWIPFEQIRRIEVSAPRRLRELIWVPASIELIGQPPGDVFIPVLYVNSHAHPDNQVKLGRMTEWTALEETIVTGAGQRVLMIDGEERALLEIRELTFDHASAAPAAG